MREERRQSVSESRALRMVFVAKRDEMIGG
jgi:hypothetical protein